MLHPAYVAGLIDGEGTITLQKGSKFRYPTISVANNYRELLEPLKEQYGGSISTKLPKNINHKTSYQWKIVYDSVLNLLDEILPFMLEPEKIRRGTLLLLCYKQVVRRNGKYSPEDLAARERFEKEFFNTSSAT